MTLSDLSKDKQRRILKDVAKEMAAWYGFDLTDSQIAALLDEDCGFWVADILVCGFDTCAKAGLADQLARRCTGRDWPCGGEDEKACGQFWKDLSEGARRLGYRPSAGSVWDLEARNTQAHVRHPVEAGSHC